MRGTVERDEDTADEKDAVHQIGELRAQGCRLYYFVPDFASDAYVWRAVFHAYLCGFSAADRAALILLVPEGDCSAVLGEMQEHLLACGTDAPLVLVYPYTEELLSTVLQQEDCLVTTKETVSLCCAEIAARTGAEIVYGMDWHPHHRVYDVSVCVATYRSDDEKLFTTLTSVIRQQGCSIEILIGDDGSAEFDAQHITLWLLQRGCKDFQILHSPENQGTVKNAMRMFLHAHGRYLKLISPGDYLYGDRVLADMMHFMQESDYRIAFGRACYYHREVGRYTIVDRMNPTYLRPHRERDIAAVKQAYLICQDYAVGASFMGERHLVTAYMKELAGRVVYTEDAVYMLMIADDIVLGFWDQNFVWYEYDAGISSGRSDVWRARIFQDNCAALAVLAARHPELRALCSWHTRGRPWEPPYAPILLEQHNTMERTMERESYLQNVDPTELQKLVYAPVDFA